MGAVTGEGEVMLVAPAMPVGLAGATQVRPLVAIALGAQGREGASRRADQAVTREARLEARAVVQGLRGASRTVARVEEREEPAMLATLPAAPRSGAQLGARVTRVTRVVPADQDPKPFLERAARAGRALRRPVEAEEDCKALGQGQPSTGLILVLRQPADRDRIQGYRADSGESTRAPSRLADRKV